MVYEKYEEPLVRRHVAWALGEIGTVEALNALRERLTEETDPGAMYNEALRLDPNLADAHVDLGNALRSKQQSAPTPD